MHTNTTLHGKLCLKQPPAVDTHTTASAVKTHTRAAPHRERQNNSLCHTHTHKENTCRLLGKQVGVIIITSQSNQMCFVMLMCCPSSEEKTCWVSVCRGCCSHVAGCCCKHLLVVVVLLLPSLQEF